MSDKAEMRKKSGACRTGKSLHEHLFSRDAGGPVPPAAGFDKGGPVKKRAAGGATPADRLTRGESTGKRTGSDNPSHDLTRGKAIRRAMGGVGKERLGQMD